MFKALTQKWRIFKATTRENKILSLWQSKRYDKLLKLFPKLTDYNSFKINQFPLIYFFITENDQQAINAFLTKTTYKDQILLDDNNPMQVNPITFAFLDGKHELVGLMEQFGGNLNKLNKSAQNLLHLSAIYKREEAFTNGITRNININFPDEFGNTPFHYAARAGSPEMVKCLLAAKAKKTQNKIYQYPVHMAIESRSEETLELLKNDVSLPYPKFHPIHSASISGSSVMLKHILQIKPASLNFKDYKGLTPLHYAILLQNHDMVKTLLKTTNILVNDQDECGNTPLHLAIMNQNVELSQLLLNSGANFDIANQDGLCPADYGITSKSKTIHSLMLKYQSTSQKIDEWTKSKFH